MATISCSCLCLPPLINSSLSSPSCVSPSLRRGGHFGITRRNAAFPLPAPWPRPRPMTSISPASASSVPDAIPDQGTDTATATIISALLFIAFIGLSILTIGVIYIAVTDFQQKRLGEKFQKEEAADKKKKGGGKKRQTMMKARAGPKGFGQKIVEIQDDDI